MSYTITPQFIIDTLQECLNAGIVPSIRQGKGGNSHTSWFVEFGLLANGRVRSFYVKITSSYGLSADFCGFSFDGFNEFEEFKSITPLIVMAKKAIAELTAINA